MQMLNAEFRMRNDKRRPPSGRTLHSSIRHSTFRISHSHARPRNHCAGVSLVELLLALAISAMLLTATMVAIDASFHAYAVAAETATTQATTRLLTHRLLMLIRTSTAHGPLQADATSSPPATLAGDTITTPYLELVDPNDRFIRIEYRPATEELWVITQPAGGTGLPLAQPILRGVTNATFSCHRKKDPDGVYVLDRATMDLTVEITPDTTLDLERNTLPPIRIIASTKPRKIE